MAEKYLSGTCPHCLAKIEYTDQDTSVLCNCCDTYVSISDLHSSLSISNRPAGGNTQADLVNNLVLGIETPESGIAYLDHFFLTYDWEEYYGNTMIAIDHITKMVEKNKIKNAANGQTWLLEFKSIAIPLAKKIQGLKKLEQKLVDKYTGEDDTELFSDFDNYRKVVEKLISQKDNLVKVLVADIQFSEKYGVDKNAVNESKAQLMKINQALGAIKKVEKLEDIPLVQEKIQGINENVEKKLAALGVDAQTTYAAAVKAYMFNENKFEALRLFNTIKGYKDSLKYIKKINSIYNYDGQLYDFAGKKYYASEDKAETLDLKSMGKKKKSGEEDLTNKGKTFSLHNVVDTIPVKQEFIKGISKIIAAYGNNIFYIKNNKKICYFNVISQIETSIDAANANDYKNLDNEYEIYFSNDKSKFFMKKKLELKGKTGCLKSLFGKKKAEDNVNNYQVILVDLVSNSVSAVVPECIDIMEVYDDKIFYLYGYKLEDNDDIETNLMIYDVATGIKEKVLSSQCIIDAAHNGNVIYSTYSPNGKNKLLYNYNIETKTSLLLEDNFYRFFGIFNNKVYYTVGNDNFESLFSIDFDGSNRSEIMLNIENIIFISSNWMYIVKGYGRNRLLLKVSLDGKKRYYICNKFKSFVKFASGYIYYIDIYNSLHIVRNDGNEDRELADNLDADSIIVDSNNIYYMRNEDINYHNRKGASLYKMDLNGHNIKKIMFDINSYAEYDENTLFVCKSETVDYEVTTPIKKNKETVTKQKFFLTRYYKYDKLTGDLEIFMNVGLPDPEKELQGCFGKKKKAKATYRELPPKYDYTRYDRAQAGDNFVEKSNAGAANASGCGNGSQGCAPQGNKKSGCAPQGNKKSGCAPQGNKKSGCAPR